MNAPRTLVAAVVAATALLSGCASSPYNNGYGSNGYGNNGGHNNTASMGYGVIESIQVTQAEARTSGGGAVVGALVGALAGNQVGSGSGRTAATVAGAAGGALAGRALTRNSSGGGTGDSYRVAVRMDNGSVQTLVQDVQPGVQVGERVRLENGVIVERFR